MKNKTFPEGISNMRKQLLEQKDLKKNILIICTIAFVIIALYYWIYSKFHITTDDAYVNANVTQIAPRVSGRVVQLNIVNNQYVKTGDLLFTIDPVPYENAIDASKAQLGINQAQLDIAKITASRTLELVKKNAASIQDGDTANAKLRSAISATELAKANLDKAMLELEYTKITAPASGWVTNVTLRIGDIEAATQPVFALISDQEFWVDANFKETELEHIKPGQQADIEIDMYPGHHFSGVVESISGGSGTAFSLLPPQNATGNWVKVTQRVPVRVRILNPDPRYPLRIGTSATVTIHV